MLLLLLLLVVPGGRLLCCWGMRGGGGTLGPSAPSKKPRREPPAAAGASGPWCGLGWLAGLPAWSCVGVWCQSAVRALKCGFVRPMALPGYDVEARVLRHPTRSKEAVSYYVGYCV